MKAPKCKVYPPSTRYHEKVVRLLRYDGDGLVIDIQGRDFAFARITFRDPIGFRVLDERDLTEFWNAYSEPNGWFYEVEEGGWRDLEATRGIRGDAANQMYSDVCLAGRLREFLVVDDKCVSVLTAFEPEIQDVGRPPAEIHA